MQVVKKYSDYDKFTPTNDKLKSQEAAQNAVQGCIKDKGERWLGVGYAANDDSSIRELAAHYFNCGAPEETIDFWGYNLYSWCGDNTLSGSGYDKQVEFFSDYSVPVFLAEYGCNVPDGAEGRLFQDTTALYSDAMSGVFSGGIAYMYYQEENDYGLVDIDDATDEASTMSNYAALSSRVAAATPSSTQASAYTPTNSAAACPSLASNWKVAAGSLPPTPDRALCECAYDALACVPAEGLDTESYGSIFGFICSEDPALCAAINSNTTAGVYGAYAACNATQKLGVVMDAYYRDQGKAVSACDHDGSARVRDGGPGAAAASCEAKMESATAAASAGGASSTNGAGGGEESSGVVGYGVRTVSLFGRCAVGLYSVAAVGVGIVAVVL